MAKINIERVSSTDYKKLLENKTIPIWANFDYMDYYPNVTLLAAFRKNNLVGTWALPVCKEEKKVLRDYRLHPYHAPLLFTTNTSLCKNIVEALFVKLLPIYNYIAIPLSVNFNHCSVLSSYKTFIEWRHTYIADSFWLQKGLTGKKKNDIKHAAKKVKISNISAEEFIFKNAIINEKDIGNNQRALMAKHLYKDKKCVCLRAHNNAEILGEVLVALDNNTAYLMHSWFERNSVRGIPSLLISKVIEEVLEKRNFSFFDFEGSVIPNVDNFFSGFNAKIYTYPYIHWAFDENVLIQNMLQDIFSKDRLKKISK